eukprot:6150986-Pleurochrysis_carterae.AAC.1
MSKGCACACTPHILKIGLIDSKIRAAQGKGWLAICVQAFQLCLNRILSSSHAHKRTSRSEKAAASLARMPPDAPSVLH